MLYYLLSFQATISSRTKNKEQWFKRSKAHSIAGIRESLMARVLNSGSASFKNICSHCFCPDLEPSDMNWKLVKKTTSVCSEKHQLFRLYFTYYAQNEIGFFFSKYWFYNAKCQKVFKSCPKVYFERKQKNGQLHHSESQNFIGDIYQREVGKAELG